jgi:hypothetical protein
VISPKRAREILADVEQRMLEQTAASRACGLANRWWFAVIAGAFGAGFVAGRFA